MAQYKIGYTTGVYDLFHVGHLHVLEMAKARCGYLIVGVSTDELVKQEKHKRPIIPFSQRVEIVRAIRCVDEVIAQTDKDKLGAYLRLPTGFDAMFVGSDWQGTEQWKAYEAQFRPYGVDIVYLPHTDGVSSTLLAQKLREYVDL